MVTVLDLTPITQLTREQFYALCQANPSLPLERSPGGALIIMAPVDCLDSCSPWRSS